MGLLDRFDVVNGPVTSLSTGTLKVRGMFVGKVVEEKHTPPPAPVKREPDFTVKRETRSVREIIRAQSGRTQRRRDVDPACPKSTIGLHWWQSNGICSFTKLPRQQCADCGITRLTPKDWVKPPRRNQSK